MINSRTCCLARTADAAPAAAAPKAPVAAIPYTPVAAAAPAPATAAAAAAVAAAAAAASAAAAPAPAPEWMNNHTQVRLKKHSMAVVSKLVTVLWKYNTKVQHGRQLDRDLVAESIAIVKQSSEESSRSPEVNIQ